MPKESDRDKRQRRAQLAIVAIAESGEDPTVILSELARAQAFLNRTWDEVQDRSRQPVAQEQERAA